MKTLSLILWLLCLCFFAALSLIPELLPASGGTDKILHLLGYTMLALFPALSFKSRRAKILTACLLFCGGVGAEFLQEIIGGRTGSISDAAANMAGIALGFITAFFLRKGWNAVPAICAVLLFTPCLSFAQAQFPDDLMQIKPRIAKPGTDRGIRAGAFLLNPEIGLSATYDDNVLRAPSRRESDIVENIKPSLSAQSDWNRHALFLSADGNLGYYRHNTLDDYKDYTLSAVGRYDLAYETYLHAALMKNRQFLGFGNADDPDVSRNGSVTIQTQEAGFVRTLGRIWLKIFGRKEQADYSFGTSGAGSNEYSRRDTENGEIFLGYAYIPGNILYVNAARDISDYDLSAGGVRHARGLDLRAGLKIAPNGPFRGGIFAGYLRRDHDDIMQDTDSRFIGGDLYWTPTRLTQLSLSANRRFIDTLTLDSAGIFQSRYQFALDNSFTTRLRGGFFAGLEDNDYLVAHDAAGRTNQTYYTGLQGSYEPSDALALQARYDFRKRFSDRDGDEYRNNRIFLSIIYRY
ncbi:MAG: VanZ family protein [Alphaproteobacteria bacterium]|nr:VanZ family protein [Alphaproteobacteria bacterium]